MAHFGALLEQFHNLRMNVEAVGNANQPVGNFGQLFARQPGVDFVFRFVAAVKIRRPIFGQSAELRNLFEPARFGLLFVVLFADGFGDRGGVDPIGLGVNLP